MYGIQKTGFNQNYVTFGIRPKVRKINAEDFKTMLQKKFVDIESTIIDLNAKISNASSQNKNVDELKGRLEIYTELSKSLKSQLKRLKELKEVPQNEFYNVVANAERRLLELENEHINLRNKQAEEAYISEMIHKFLY